MKQTKIVELASKKDIVRLKELAPRLLQWYWKNARVLPWRENKDPYRIWVSEIMLQQTRVEAVIPYYERFLQALPNIQALANVPEDALLKLWEGLGYYSRVRNLQKAAKVLAEEYQAQLPDRYEELLKLPGIGEYTAGAIASIAYSIPVPAVDGNYYRVLARLLSSDADITQSINKKQFYNLAKEILPTDAPGDFNQAVMDLGATVCLPNTEPQCLLCPIRDGCKGYENGTAADLPNKPKKKPRRIEQRTILTVFFENTVLLHQRENKELLPGLWEFINLEGWLSLEEVKKQLLKIGLKILHIDAIDSTKHIFSHVQWEMKGYSVMVDSPIALENHRWASRDDIQSVYAVPSAFRTYVGYAKEQLG